MSINNSSSFWQSPLWDEILSETHQAETFWYTGNDHTWLIERRKIIGTMTGLYVLGVEENLQPKHIADLRKIAKKNDIFIQIEPIGRSKTPGTQLKKAPFRRFIEPTTAVLSLASQTEEQLLHNFSEKGRYNIRVAERRGVTTHWVRGDDISLYDLPSTRCREVKTYAEIFFDLLNETTERNGFSHNALLYYQTFLRVLEKHNAGGLLIATKDGVLHCAGVFVYWNHHAIYYYGASSTSAEVRRDHGTYLLQWEAIKEALRRDCKEYDFLGISSEEGDKLAGVTAFKMRFAPDTVILSEEIVIVYKPFILFILRALTKIRKLLR